MIFKYLHSTHIISLTAAIDSIRITVLHLYITTYRTFAYAAT